MNEKDFEKINIKMEISAWASTSVLNFSQAKKIQILGAMFKKKYESKENLKK